MSAGNCAAMDYSAFKEEWEEYVAELIHERWLKRGCPEGSPAADWFTVAQGFDQAFLAELDLGLPA